MREYILKQDGGFYQRDIAEVEVELGDAFVAALGANRVTQIYNLHPLPGMGNAHLTVTNKIDYWCVNLPRIVLKCPWRLSGEFLVPEFGNTDLPVMNLEWVPNKNESLKLLLLLGIVQEDLSFHGMWFFAKDNNGATWRLPLPNLHDDCAVCSGIRDRLFFSSLTDGLGKLLDIFDRAPWNADLWKSAEHTQAFFRFKPGPSATFIQQPVHGDWQKHCLKVATAMNKFILE